ncbi:hypothetical protein L218DRAFT_635625 [Marasmius fiardii PR-910]|nr:hypothetical protein L218DRAFT_635625 [Marasmius fiardii PR-910]
MRLVTETRTCPAYALYSSARQSETVRLVFKADASPIGIPAGIELDQGWYREQTSGSFRSGSNNDKVFTPFFQLLTINTRGHLLREDPKIPQKPRWEISALPWDSLDEDGEEIPDDYDSAESSGSENFEGGD